MASEPKVGDVRQDGSLRQQVWLGSGWYYVGSPIATKLVSAEISAAREMREVAIDAVREMQCLREQQAMPDQAGDARQDAIAGRLARLIGGGE